MPADDDPIGRTNREVEAEVGLALSLSYELDLLTPSSDHYSRSADV